MFCRNCGKELPKGSNFCSFCGVNLGEIVKNSSTELIPAKCTSCGGMLQVDSTLKSAVCPFCNTEYIVDQAINNYNIQAAGDIHISSATINVSGTNEESLLARAKEFEKRSDIEHAVEYYNKVLDANFKNDEARERLEFIENNYKVLMRDKANCRTFKSMFGPLIMFKQRVVFLYDTGEYISWKYSEINKINKNSFGILFINDTGILLIDGKKKISAWSEALILATTGVFTKNSSEYIVVPEN